MMDKTIREQKLTPYLKLTTLNEYTRELEDRSETETLNTKELTFIYELRKMILKELDNLKKEMDSYIGENETDEDLIERYDDETDEISGVDHYMIWYNLSEQFHSYINEAQILEAILDEYGIQYEILFGIDVQGF